MKPQLPLEEVARVCHEVNRAYCLSIGDMTQPAWDSAPAWMKESALNGVKAHYENPGLMPAESHKIWLAQKLAAGWTYGPLKDAARREHPCMLAYDQLPREQQTKDYLFAAVVKALA